MGLNQWWTIFSLILTVSINEFTSNVVPRKVLKKSWVRISLRNWFGSLIFIHFFKESPKSCTFFSSLISIFLIWWHFEDNLRASCDFFLWRCFDCLIDNGLRKLSACVWFSWLFLRLEINFEMFLRSSVKLLDF
jgi:hypothetical protein